MKFHQLQAVVAIAEHGSLRAAARHLNTAQPALTRNLAELERELGTAMFERRARGMSPTMAGVAFIRRAASILNEARRAAEEVEQINAAGSGHVMVGLSIAAHILMLPGVFRPFTARFPNVEVQIVESVYLGVEPDLRNGRMDFYIGPEPERPVAESLVQELLFSNTRTVLCRRNHPLAGATSLRELVGAEWLAMSPPVAARDEFQGLFSQHGLTTPRIRVRSQSVLTLMTALSNSDLLALAPAQWLAHDLTSNALQAISLREVLPAPAIVMVRRGELPLTPAATYLLDLLCRKIPRAENA